MYENSLTQAGLTYPQAIVYEALIKNGQLPAGKLTKKTPFKRGLVYKTLEDLVKFELVEKTEDNSKIALFQTKHPLELQTFAERKEKEAKNAKLALAGMIGSIISDYNLIHGRPGVIIHEGKEGLYQVLNDSLKSKTEILTYADIEGMEKYLGKENTKYVKKRKELDIKKRGIVADTPYARQYLKNYDKSVTDIRMIDGQKFSMFLEMEIYDNKVSFMTFSEKKLIGMIIENEEIYKTQKSIFEMVWANSMPLDKVTDSST